MYIYIYTHTDHSGPMGDHTLQHTAAHWRTFSKLLSINTKATHWRTFSKLLCCRSRPVVTTSETLRRQRKGSFTSLILRPSCRTLAQEENCVCVCDWQDAFICVSYRSDVWDIAMRCHTQYMCVETRQYAHTVFYTQHSLPYSTDTVMFRHTYTVCDMYPHMYPHICLWHVSAQYPHICLWHVSALCAEYADTSHTVYVCRNMTVSFEYRRQCWIYRRLYTVCDMYAHSIRIDSMRIQCAYKTLCAYSLLYSTLSSFDTRIRILYCFDTRVDTVLFRHTNVQTVLFRNTWRYCLLSTYAHTVLYQYHHRQIARAPTDIYSYTSINIYT